MRADLPKGETPHHLQERTRLRIPLCQLRVPPGTAIPEPGASVRRVFVASATAKPARSYRQRRSGGHLGRKSSAQAGAYNRHGLAPTTRTNGPYARPTAKWIILVQQAVLDACASLSSPVLVAQDDRPRGPGVTSLLPC
jgi:hypothetical protein